ncbi:MAG: replication restart helicase PriA, partial [Candidatus Sumerlaeota bacterium]
LNARPDLAEEETQGKYTWLALQKRAGGASLPEIELIDMAAGVRDERHTGLLSERLERAIGKRLEKGEQSILFLNRRGFSNFLLCLSCKTAIRCPHCDVVMTWHKSIGSLMCHFCGEQQPKPDKCPECETPDPAPMGAGTQRIEEDVSKAFPEARVLRIDLDTTRGKHGFLRLWEQIERGDADVMLGTQMISKGLHLERVTLVGVVSADHSLFLPDFRAAERAFAQLTQVAGRAGRMADRGGEVIIQTFVPHHYAIQRAIRHDVEGFWERELHMRQMLRFPPYWRLLLVRVSGEDRDKVRSRATRLGALLKEIQFKRQEYRHLGILGPVPCPIEKLQDKIRWQIVIRGQSPAKMRALVQAGLKIYDKDKGRAGVHLTLDMDPLDLL